MRSLYFRLLCLMLASIGLDAFAQESTAALSENQPPSLTVANLVYGLPDRKSDPIPILISDPETAAENLTLTLAIVPLNRWNTNLFRIENVELGGAGSERWVRILPEPGQYGSLILRVTVEDELGARAVGELDFRVEVFQESGFLDPATGVTGAGFAWVDVDSDGLLDWAATDRWIRNIDGTNFVRGNATSGIGAGGSPVFGDADNNGTVDFAVGGSISAVPVTLVFTNSFEERSTSPKFHQLTNVLSPGFYGGALSWIDYDLDGDADLFGTGAVKRRGANRSASIFWRNDGSLNFTAVSNLIPALEFAGAAWTDVDNDGDPDLLAMGTAENLGRYTKILLNDGTGAFLDSGIELPAISRGGKAAWGDIDQDGRSDLLLYGGGTITLYRNTPEGPFTEMVRFESLLVNQCLLADLTNDGLLDVFYFGREDLDFSPYDTPRVYINKGNWEFLDANSFAMSQRSEMVSPLALGDFDLDGILDAGSGVWLYRGTASRSNEHPAAPSGLGVSIEGHSVMLSWAAATDLMQTNGFTYNVRVGTTSGGSEIMSPLSLPSGRRLIVELGNAFGSLRRKLRSLKPGRYYWSVQTIDASFEGSPFATEQTFTIGMPNVEFTSTEARNGSLFLKVQSDSPTVFILQQSTDLKTWSPLQTNSLPQGESILTVPAIEAAAFYRLIK